MRTQKVEKMVLQQHLPFTVLKPSNQNVKGELMSSVATAPTVYGIETFASFIFFDWVYKLQQHLPFTVLKRY